METEYDNHAALSLYEHLGFIREKRLFRFYLNGKDAFRLVLVVPPDSSDDEKETMVDNQITKAFRSSYQYLAPARMMPVPPPSYNPDDEVSLR